MVAARWLRVVTAIGILFVVFFVWLENLCLHMGGFMVEKERGLELWVGGGVVTLE